ncbi:septum formation inhibitor Maf [Candidatus Poribacteria bacterium]|nr:septum formation inhibitor Maf [Candidatus Poribacteria bacterium]
MKKIILASASPRREQLLKQIGIVFEIIPSNVNEKDFTHHDPVANTQLIALSKAQDVAAKVKDVIIIGADTQVIIDDEVLGKPEDDVDAINMLRKLSGKKHRVITGVAIIDGKTGKNETWAEITEVVFRKISEDEIIDYIETGEHRGKAGAYGIQGRAAAFVKRIEGCYFNVVGLPLAKLSQKLRKA